MSALWPTPSDRLPPDMLRDGPLPRLSVLRKPGERPRLCGVLDDDARLGRVRVAWWEIESGRAEWREGWVERAWLEAR